MVAGRQVSPLKGSTQLVKGTSERSFRPSRNHNQLPLCSKTRWREHRQCPCLAHPMSYTDRTVGGIWGVGQGLHWVCAWQESPREGAESWTGSRGRGLLGTPPGAGGRLLLLRSERQGWGLFLLSEPNSQLHCAATFPRQLLATSSLDPMKQQHRPIDAPLHHHLLTQDTAARSCGCSLQPVRGHSVRS